jgi:hypothetical protein
MNGRILIPLLCMKMILKGKKEEKGTNTHNGPILVCCKVDITAKGFK